MTVNSRPSYGEPIGTVDKNGRVRLSEMWEKFIDDLIGQIGSNAGGITAITNQQQVIEGGESSGEDDVEPLLPPMTVVQTTVQVINHLHMDCGDEDQIEPMFVGPR